MLRVFLLKVEVENVGIKRKEWIMLYWLAVFFGENLGNKNRIEQYIETKQPRLLRRISDKKLMQHLDRGNDEEFEMMTQSFKETNQTAKHYFETRSND